MVVSPAQMTTKMVDIGDKLLLQALVDGVLLEEESLSVRWVLSI